MKKRLIVVVVLVGFGAAGCGGAQNAARPRPAPKIPRALAQSWARQADDVAVAIDAGDGCTAQQRAATLRTQIVRAVNAHRVPRRYLEPLVSTANDLAGRITCNPPAPVVVPSAQPAKHGHHGHHGHGNGNGNGNGDEGGD